MPWRNIANKHCGFGCVKDAGDDLSVSNEGYACILWEVNRLVQFTTLYDNANGQFAVSSAGLLLASLYSWDNINNILARWVEVEERGDLGTTLDTAEVEVVIWFKERISLPMGRSLGRGTTRDEAYKGRYPRTSSTA
ncbi:hypothetical protein AAG570_012774 [Ranatra chinensis]|uniref:Uncharacterized protein n=1 Tax=Ranatra chinensis TaxID=642074 RepID=A0ABD0YEU3_9HEMI